MHNKEKYENLMTERSEKISNIFEEAVVTKGVVVGYEDDIYEREENLDTNKLFGGLRNEIEDKIRGQLFELIEDLKSENFIKGIEFED